MLKKLQVTISHFYIKILIFFLSIFILEVNAETKIIAKSGDTLLKLSNQYGVSLKELMHKNNLNDASIGLGGKVIIIPIQKSKDKEELNNQISHRVKAGDTLYKIASDYNVNIKDIISINRLDNSSYLKKNQIIILPEGAVKKNSTNKKYSKLVSKKVFYHQSSKVEEVSEIAKIHKVSIGDINSLNKLKSPLKINPNTKLKIRDHKTSRWLKHGSIIVNWSDWTYLDGNYIAQAKNKKNKAFYIAVNCQKRSLNNSLINSNWTNWYFPESDFEFKLINDFCDQDFNF